MARTIFDDVGGGNTNKNNTNVNVAAAKTAMNAAERKESGTLKKPAVSNPVYNVPKITAKPVTSKKEGNTVTVNNGNTKKGASYNYDSYYTHLNDPYVAKNENPNSYTGTDKNDSYYNALMDAFLQQNEAARQQALDAILQNLNAVKGTYKSQIKDVINEYNGLVNENEVKKEQARQIIRENQANRGQLDSGMGRQEQLDMNIGYDNVTNNLKLQRQKAVNDIYNLIAQAEAEANTNRANVNNTYANSMLEYQLANM